MGFFFTSEGAFGFFFGMGVMGSPPVYSLRPRDAS